MCTGCTGTSGGRLAWIASIMCGATCQPDPSRMAMACSGTNAAATLGPDAINAGSSLATSEITYVKSSAPRAPATAANRPPLTRERWRRTRFISCIGAPERTRWSVIACFSARVMPTAGAQSNDEPPPDIRKRTRSPCPAVNASSKSRSPASRLWSSGTG